MDDTQVTGTDAPAQVDTVEAPTNEASQQVNNDAPEVAAAQEADVNATDTAEDKLYAGKYKSPEDLEKSYLELQSKATRDNQEKAELTRILNEAFTVPEPQVQATQEDDFDEPNPLAEKVERMERQGAVQNFIFAHPDADAVNMNTVLSQDPVIKQIQGHDAKLEYAYYKSQNMTSNKAIEEAKKSAASQAQAKVVEKQAAQVESAQSAAKTDENSELYERATGNYSREDREAARKALIRKNLVNL